jgi:hypothetical protein
MNGLDGDNAMSDKNINSAGTGSEDLVLQEVVGRVGCITLNRPKASAHDGIA